MQNNPKPTLIILSLWDKHLLTGVSQLRAVKLNTVGSPWMSMFYLPVRMQPTDITAESKNNVRVENMTHAVHHFTATRSTQNEPSSTSNNKHLFFQWWEQRLTYKKYTSHKKRFIMCYKKLCADLCKNSFLFRMIKSVPLILSFVQTCTNIKHVFVQIRVRCVL